MNTMDITTMPLLVLLLGAAPAAYADDKICRNAPRPTGGRNIGGDKEDQCARL